MSPRNRFRATLAAVVALAAWIGLGASPATAQEFTYKLLLGSQKMGTQVIRVAPLDATSNGFDVSTRMKIDFSPFFFITVKVQQVTREVWRDGHIVSFESKTNQRGDKYQVRVKRDGERLMVTGGEKPVSASPMAAPTSYWYEPLFKERTQFFDTKTGKLRDQKLEFMDTAQVTYGGSQYTVRHYRLANDEKSRELWYFEETGILYMTRSEEQGSTVTYVLQ